ncbi:hypothetical protein LY76DRAFT_399165 [Colletotrichum caudatum]|nr:hypothetical protein LY76DRAFT_399165 [Colletotrichum caudatum]
MMPTSLPLPSGSLPCHADQCSIAVLAPFQIGTPNASPKHLTQPRTPVRLVADRVTDRVDVNLPTKEHRPTSYTAPGTSIFYKLWRRSPATPVNPKGLMSTQMGKSNVRSPPRMFYCVWRQRLCVWTAPRRAKCNPTRNTGPRHLP